MASTVIELDDPIKNLIRTRRIRLGDRVRKVLDLLEVHTVRDFLQLDPRKVLDQRGYGLTTCQEVIKSQTSLRLTMTPNAESPSHIICMPIKSKPIGSTRTTRIGGFVTSSDNDLGIGKLKDLSYDTSYDTAVIEYFDSPTSFSPEVVTVPLPSVTPIQLYYETRVYYQDPATFVWTAGRVIEEEDGHYLVQFPNRKTLNLQQESLYCRWSVPIDDPTDHLAYRINETPRFHEGRSRFVRSLIDQRGACCGMTGLLSSVIELEDYQVQVVRRVLNDPVQRYLLADEVGLGKTIEAGAIIRQYILDRREGHSVLIIVPSHLVAQWYEELKSKFILGQYLEKSVHVCGLRDATIMDKLFHNLGMLVLDEAHQLASLAESRSSEDRRVFNAVRRNALQVRRLLLLSATPALHNEKAFHTMLHLLDPVIYPLGEFDSFRKRVANRHKVAEVFHGLTQEASNYFLEGHLDTLSDLFPDDNRLKSLIGDLRSLLAYDVPEDDENRNQAVRAIRTHVSEVYRLHRRMLRNRRSHPSIEVLVAGRAGLERVVYVDRLTVAINETLEEWREEVITELGHDYDHHLIPVYGALFRIFVEAGNSDISVLDSILRVRLAQSELKPALIGFSAFEARMVSSTPLFESERQIIRRLRDIIRLKSGEDGRLDALQSTVEQILRHQRQVIVFSNSPITADRIYQHLRQRFYDRVYRHQTSSVPGEDLTDWHNFRGRVRGSVLVCDKFAEDGLNLQGGNCTMVHYDLPFSPNRIEQRIGRVDRYGRGDSVGSIALLEHDSPLIQAWCNCLDSAFRVFDRSIASLQLLIEDRMKEIFSKILFERASIIDRATLELAGPDGEIERELKRIALQDALDSMENSNVEDDGIYDRLSELETHWKELKTASEGWIVSQLQFRVRPENETQDSGVIRYKYRLGHKGENTLVPIQDLLGRFAHAIDRSAPGFDAQNIYTHAYTYKRVTAQSRGVRLARLGDYFFDAMMDYVRWDDRGTCFALWRFLPNHNLETPAELAFRFDFLVETEMEPSYRCLVDGENVTKESIQRKADYLFPPIIRSVWIDEEMNVIVDEERVAILGRPYRPSDQQYFQDGWVDFNLKAERWKLIEHWYDASSCCSLCQEARRVAETIFYNDINLTGLIEQRADRCSIEASIHLAQMKSRLVYADGAQRRHEEEQLRQEEALLMALLEGIKSPHVRLDSLGAIFLSTINPFKSEDSR